jgi:signal transduction histidine kinase
MRFTHWSVALLGIIQLLFILLLIDRTILLRLTRLETFVQKVGLTADASSRLPSMGEDELGRLGHNINTMLEGLENAQSALRRTEEELRASQGILEQRVREKTSELENQLADRSRIESEAVVSAHLASLGELAAGVAHEINNPVNGIINYAQLLKDQAEEGQQLEPLTDGILEEG